MKTRVLTGTILTFSICAGPMFAQTAADLEQVNRQLQDLKAAFEKQQRELREAFEKRLQEQQTKIESLQKQLEARTNLPPESHPPAVESKSDSEARLTAPAWSPTQPIRIGSARNYLNLSLDALMAAGSSTANDIPVLEPGGHDPNQRGFTLQGLETVFEGMVDPYFRAQANLSFQLNSNAESTFEVEEAYGETMSLPFNLQVKAGQYLEDFGRINTTHPHSWDFVDIPLVNARLLGPDGLRSLGARVSWLAPTPFYSELFLSVANSQGETAYSFRYDHDGQPFMGRPTIDRAVDSLSDMLFLPRYAVSFDLPHSQTLLAGVSAAVGPNSSGTDTATQILGVDLFWKWKSPRQHAGFPFVTWQTEGMIRRYEAGAYGGDATTPALPGETVYDYGVYSQVAWGFRQGWVVALRGDYVFPGATAIYEQILGPDPSRAPRWRISPSLTFYPSEFSKLRLQYNFDDRQGIGTDNSVWLQLELLIGSHAAHKF